jgi:hypothetical protein
VRAEPEQSSGFIAAFFGAQAPRRKRPSLRRLKRAHSERVQHVSVSKATICTLPGFDSHEEARSWLGGLRSDKRQAEATIALSLRRLNRVLRAWAAASWDPSVCDLAVEHALAIRLGYASGQQIVDGSFEEAYETPPAKAQARRDRLVPQRRLGAILGARAPHPVCCLLVLRARQDVDAQRLPEGVIQTQTALDALLSELGDRLSPATREDLHKQRAEIAAWPNTGQNATDESLLQQIEKAVADMEALLKRHLDV